MIRKINIALLAGIVVVFVGGLLSANAWSTYNNNLKIKLRVTQEQVDKLQAQVKTLKADNQAQQNKIVELESQPK